MRALIDTCIVIDALQNRQPFHNAAQELFLAVANRRFDGFLTAKSIADIYYLTHRSTHSDAETRRILTTLFQLFDLRDTRGIDCRRALSTDITDYEDAIMVESAVREGMDCIVTRNLRDYTKASIPVYTPDDFLALLTPTEEATSRTDL